VYVPAPSAVAEQPPERPAHSPARVLMMGNLGLSQGIAEVVGALDSSGALERSGAVLRIAGSGVAEPDVRAAISTDRVEMLGLLLRDQMDAELKTTTLGIVTTRPDVVAFNLPSRMMNFLAEGIPVLVAAHPDAEIARMVDDNGLGWIADIRDLGSVPAALERALASPAQLRERGARAHAYALEHLSADAVARRTESILASALDGRR
jgi:colanic acid biosynthesis glycosyl transferase WcaI